MKIIVVIISSSQSAYSDPSTVQSSSPVLAHTVLTITIDIDALIKQFV